jgi:hypothetical protein
MAAGDAQDGARVNPAADPFLRTIVAERCANRPPGLSERSLLRGLVVDLYREGIDPATATDALILARCGDLADIVTEMVAGGGELAAMPVIDSAILLAGREAAVVVERAAARGLMRAGRERVAAQRTLSPPLAGAGDDYAMLYFPVGEGASRAEQTPGTVAQGLGAAPAGYGIYTFILAGDLASGANEGERASAYDELLRVIETYVTPGVPDDWLPAERHTFLLPASRTRPEAAAAVRAGAGLSAAMRDALTDHLRRVGQGPVAARLATSPGPFLISSLEPRLVPVGTQAARLVVDLSDIGPEYMYSLVDAYDRRISRADSGRVDSLRRVRARLDALLPNTTASATSVSGDADWVFLIERRTPSAADAASNQRPTPRLAFAGAVSWSNAER